jgi:AcrR family transcriptional regulator
MRVYRERFAEGSGLAHDHVELRARILEASLLLIETEGLARLSMREVARRAGVTHQAPYHYFADREAILGEIAAQGFEQLNAAIELAVAASDKQTSASERVSAMVRAYLDFACGHPAHFRLMFRPELVDLANCPRAQLEGSRAFATVKRVVHEAVAAGLPERPSEEALVATIWSVAHGMACLILDGPLAREPESGRDQQKAGVVATIGMLIEASIATNQPNRARRAAKLDGGRLPRSPRPTSSPAQKGAKRGSASEPGPARRRK